MRDLTPELNWEKQNAASNRLTGKLRYQLYLNFSISNAGWNHLKQKEGRGVRTHFPSFHCLPARNGKFYVTRVYFASWNFPLLKIKAALTEPYIRINIAVYLWSEKVELFTVSSVQFSSVAQSCQTLCVPMNHSTPGLPVHHQLPKFRDSRPSS